MNNKVVYTVVTGNYDTLKEPCVITKGFDYICFTDNSSLKSKFWDIRLIDSGKDKVRAQREIKCRPHIFLPEYDKWIYIDCSYKIVRDLIVLMSPYPNSLWVAKLHPTRTNIYQEAKKILELCKDKEHIINRQLNSYPDDIEGLYETGVMIRSNNEVVNKIGDDWWNEIKQHSHRDQMSLPYVFFKNNFTPTTIMPKVIKSYFALGEHNKQVKNIPNVYYFTAGRGDKNIGKAINSHCELVPNDDDWICSRDGDSMFLNPYWSKQIEDIIRRNEEYVDIIACSTNRLNSEKQRPFPEDFCEMDMLHHWDRSEWLLKEYYNKVDIVNTPIAGLLMLMKKKVWKDIKFKENSIYFDTQFCNEALEKGYKIGIAKGLYLFHFYRAYSDNPTKYKKHLQ